MYVNTDFYFEDNQSSNKGYYHEFNLGADSGEEDMIITAREEIPNPQKKFQRSKNSPKFDPELIARLMNYVEKTLESRLDDIEGLINKNKTEFRKVKKEYVNVETKVMEIKRQKCSTRKRKSMISDDIKFFFNIVKGNPVDSIPGYDENSSENNSQYRGNKDWEVAENSPRFHQISSPRQRTQKQLKSNFNRKKGRKAPVYKVGLPEGRKRKRRSKSRFKENVNPNQIRKRKTEARRFVFSKGKKGNVAKRVKTPVKNSDRCIVRRRSVLKILS